MRWGFDKRGIPGFFTVLILIRTFVCLPSVFRMRFRHPVMATKTQFLMGFGWDVPGLRYNSELRAVSLLR